MQRVPAAGLGAVDVWAPAPGSGGAFEMWLVLHGNQGAIADATWMVELRRQPRFASTIVVAPSLSRGRYDWEAPATLRALAALVGDIARRFPVDKARIYVLGYSAGASRVLSVARALADKGQPLAGIVAVAGDVGRARADWAPIKTAPLLLVCMEADDGPHTSCKLNARNLGALQREKPIAVELRRLPGDHQLDLARLAPELHDWVTTSARLSRHRSADLPQPRRAFNRRAGGSAPGASSPTGAW